MSPASESLVKKLVVFASLVVLGSSIAFLLVACGANNRSPASREQADSTSAGWRRLPAAPIAVNASATSVWTGREMIVSGVRAGREGTFIGSSEVAAAYDPATRTWRSLSPSPDKQNFCRRGAVWTGKEMLVWGCGQVAFDPATNHWSRLPHAFGGQGIVVWTGSEMIGWGGGCCGDAWSGGSAYDPAAKSWRTLARSPLAPSQGPIGAWTGHELVLLVSGIRPWQWQALAPPDSPAPLRTIRRPTPGAALPRRPRPTPASAAPPSGTGARFSSWAPAPARRTRSPTTRRRTTGGDSLRWRPATLEPPRSGPASGCWSGVGRVTTPRATCSHGTGSATTRRPTAGRRSLDGRFGREMDPPWFGPDASWWSGAEPSTPPTAGP